jgi:hypothetical protein
MRNFPFVCLFVLASSLQAGTLLIQDSFDEGMPSGWTINGDYGGTATDASEATVKTSTDYLQSGAFALTDNRAFDRSTMLYTQHRVNTTQGFKLRVDVNIGGPSGAESGDGMSFFFVDAGSVSSYNVETEGLLGGYGLYQGAPTGKNTGVLGSYNGLDGISFEFDHKRNAGYETSEYVHNVTLDNWQHVGDAGDFSADSTFYYGNGWQTVELEYDVSLSGLFFKWGYDEQTDSFANSMRMEVGGSNFQYAHLEDAYFGISAATGAAAAGGGTAYHQIDNLSLEIVPEPATLAMLAIGALGLRRKK